MKTRLLLGLLLFSSLTIRIPLMAQDPEPEVGIVEKLDQTIPMDLKFQDENGNTVMIGELINKPVILAPVYFDCPGICVQLLSGISDVVEKMDMELGKDYDIITFSFNKEDNPEKAMEKKNAILRTKGKEHAASWHFLTGDSSSIHALTNSIGYKFKQAGNDFVHPASILVLSPTGKITRYLYGVTYLPFDTKMALIEAQRGQSRPSINRVLDFCYTYDPEGRRYSLEVTKLSGIIIIFLAVLFFGFMVIKSRRKNRAANINSDQK